MSILKIKSVILFILVLFTFNSTFAQDEQMSEDDAIYMISYYANQQVMASILDTFKTKELNLAERLQSTQLSRIQIDEAFQALVNEMTINERTHSNGQLEVKSKFPNYFDVENSNKAISIELSDNDLQDANGNTIELQGSTSVGYGSSSTSSFNNGVRKTTKRITVNLSHQHLNKQKIVAPISGQIKYKVKIATEMASLKLSRENIGQSFELEGIPFKLIDLYQNKIVLNFNKKHDLYISLINLEADEKSERTGLSTMTVYELQEKDERYNNLASFSSMSAYMTKGVYELFKTQPDISLEDFKKKVSKKELLNNEKYHIIATDAYIENTIILYTPVFDYEKEIIVNFQ